MPPDSHVQETSWQFAPEIDQLWDALTRRGMHYDRGSMEREEPALANRHRASLDLALGEGGWVPRSVAETLIAALAEIEGSARSGIGCPHQKTAREALNAFRAVYPKPEEAER